MDCAFTDVGHANQYLSLLNRKIRKNDGYRAPLKIHISRTSASQIACLPHLSFPRRRETSLIKHLVPRLTEGQPVLSLLKWGGDDGILG